MEERTIDGFRERLRVLHELLRRLFHVAKVPLIVIEFGVGRFFIGEVRDQSGRGRDDDLTLGHPDGAGHLVRCPATQLAG